MDPDDAALLAFERESAAHLSGIGGHGGDDGFDAQMEAEMAREEANYQRLLRDPSHAARMAALTDLDADGDGGGEHTINDEDVMGELAELEGEMHAEGGGGGSAGALHAKRPRSRTGADHGAEHSAGSQGGAELDEDAMLAEAEAEADRMAAEEEAAARKPAPTAKPAAAAPAAAAPAAAATAAAAAAAAAVAPPRPPRTQQQQLTSASGSSVTPAPSAAAVAAADLASLQAQLLDLKRKAVEFKQGGNQAQAMEVLRNYKTVQARIQEMQAKNAAGPSAATAAAANTTAAKPVPPVAAAKPSVPSRPAAAAVAAAKPATAAASGASSAASSSASSGKLSMRATLEYDDLLSKLDSQIASLSASMKTLVAEGAGVGVAAGSKQAKLMALQYFRAKTRSTKDRDLVALARSRHLPPPQTHIEELSIQRELSFPDLGDDELQLTVLQARDLHNKAATSDPKDLSCFVTAFLEYAADLEGNMKTAAGVSSSTAKTKGASPSWGAPAAAAAANAATGTATGGWVTTLPFPYPRVAAGSSKDRSGIKKLMRSKLICVVYHKRFLLGAIEVGRAEIRLKDFSLKSELRQSLKLKDGQNRTGELDVIVRLRRPFEGIDLRSTVLPLLIVDEFEVEAAVEQAEVAAQVAQAAKQAAATSQQLSRPIESVGSSHAAAASVASVSVAAPAAAPAAVASSASATASATPVAASGVSAAELANPHEIVRMRSNDVLEAEIALVNAQIAALSKSAPAAGSEQADELDSLQDRLTAAQIQLQVLVTQVQNGKLSLSEYLDGLRKSILSESQLAIALNKQNRKPDALRVLQRVKLMKAEVANAEENQEELEQC